MSHYTNFDLEATARSSQPVPQFSDSYTNNQRPNPLGSQFTRHWGDSDLTDIPAGLPDLIPNQIPEYPTFVTVPQPGTGPPLSEHCSSVRDARTCCPEHARIDAILFSTISNAAGWRQMLGGICSYEHCDFCKPIYHQIDGDSDAERNDDNTGEYIKDDRVSEIDLPDFFNDDIVAQGLATDISSKILGGPASKLLFGSSADISEVIKDVGSNLLSESMSMKLFQLFNRAKDFYDNPKEMLTAARNNKVLTVVVIGIAAWGMSLVHHNIELVFDSLSRFSNLLVTLGVTAFNTLTKIIDAVKRAVSSRPNTQSEEANVADKDIKVQSISGFSACAATALLLCTPSTKDTDWFTLAKGALLKAGALSSGLAVATNGFIYLCNQLPDFIKEFLCDYVSPNLFNDTFSQEDLDDLITLNAINTRFHTHGDKIFLGSNLASQAVALYAHLSNKLTPIVAVLPANHMGRFLFSRIMRAAEKYLVAGTRAEAGTTRPVPWGLYLKGAPGIGKSFLVDGLCCRLFGSTKEMYSRNDSDRFWSAYYGQKFTYVDDMLAANTPAAAESVSQYLSLLSCTPHRLNMANLEDKGAYFTSRAVVATSNIVPHPTIKGLEKAAAFQRRFDIFNVSVVAEYSVDPSKNPFERKPDFKKIKSLSTAQQATFPHLRFHPFGVASDERVQWGTGITYEEIVALGMARIQANDEDYQARLQIANVATNQHARTQLKIDPEDLVVPVDHPDMKHVMDIEPQAGTVSSAKDLPATVDKYLAASNMDEKHPECAGGYRDIAEQLSHNVRLTKQQLDSVLANLCEVANAVHFSGERLPLRTSLRRAFARLASKPYEMISHGFEISVDALSRMRSHILHEYRDRHIQSAIDFKSLGIVIGTITAAYAVVEFWRDFTAVPEPQSVRFPRAQKTTTTRRRNPGRNEKRGHRIKRAHVHHDDRFEDTILTKNAGIQHYAAQAEDEEEPVPEYVAALDDNYEEKHKTALILRNIFDNMVSIHVGNRRLEGIIYNGARIVTCRHLFYPGGQMVPEGTEVEITVGTTVFTMPFEKSRLFCEDNANGTMNDTVVYCPDTMSFVTKRKLNRYFVSEVTLSKISPENNAYIMRRYTDPDQRITPLEEGVTFNQEPMSWSIEKDSKNVDIVVTETLRYEVQSDGDCGSPIIYETPQPGKILGIHIASHMRACYGIGAIITRELLDSFDASIDALGEIQPQCATSFPAKLCSTSDERIPAVAEPIGTVLGKGTSISKKTKLVPSVIASDPILKKIDYEPALLGSATDLRCKGMKPDDILFKNLNKQFDKPKKLLPPSHVKKAVADVIAIIKKQKVTGPKRELTLNEVLNKAKAYPNLGRLDYSTSEGFPWCKKRPHTSYSKRYLFNVPDDDCVDEDTNPITIADADLVEKVAQDYEDLGNGIVPNWTWKMANKDETRSRKKINAQATRSVACSPIDATIASKRSFGAFVDMFHHAHKNPDFFSAVGMNVHSSDWDELIRHFKANSEFGFDGDYSDFESILTPQLASAVFEVIDSWYDEDDDPAARTRRFTVFYAYIHSIRLVGRTAFRVHSQNPSGNWLTTIINTILLAILSRVGWLGVASIHQPEAANLVVYNNRIAEIFYGDDNAFSVRNAPWFNCETLRAFFAQFNINYTSADKNDESIGKHKRVEDIEFLKQQTAVPTVSPIPGIKYFPKTTETSLLKALKYVSKDLDCLEATQINANDCLCRAWGSGFKRFTQLREFLRSAFVNAGYEPNLYTYDYIQALWEKKHIDFNVNTEQKTEIMRAPSRIRSRKAAIKKNRNFSVAALTTPFQWKGIVVQSAEDAVVTEATLTTADSPAEATVVSPDEDTKAAVPDKDLPIQVTSVRDLMKRPFTAWKPTSAAYEFTWAPNEAMRTTPSTFNSELLRGGFMSWYSGMYAVWRGGFIVRFFGAENLAVCYDSHNEGVSMAPIAKQQYFQTNNLAQLSGLAPQAVGTVASGALEVKCPFISNRNVLAVPKRNYHIGHDQYTSGVLHVNVVDSATSVETVGLISGADDFRLAYLHTVPWVKVTGDRFFHPTLEAVDIPELILINHGVGDPLFFSQRRVLEIFPAVPNTTHNSAVTTMVVSTSALSVGELNALGYTIYPGQTINILIGQTSPPVTFDCSKFFAVADVTSMSFSQASVNSANGWNTQPLSATTTFIDENDPQHPTYLSCFDWEPELDNYLNAAFRQVAGLSVDNIGVPANTTVPLSITVNPGPEIVHLGQSYYNFNPHFHDVTTQNPLLVPDSDIKAQYHQDIHCQMEVDKDETKGVTVTDVEHVVSTGGRASIPTDSAGVMSENQLTFQDLAERWNNTTSLPWTSTHQVGSVLYSANLPWDCLTTKTNKAAFERFVYSRAGVRVTFGLQSNAFQAGKVIAFFVPLLDKDHAARTFQGHFAAMTANPHVFLNAGSSGRTTLEIPFVHPNRFLDAALANRAAPYIGSLGSLHVVVFNHLRVGPTTPAQQSRAKINVMYSFTDSEFKVIDPLTVSSLPTLSSDIVCQGAVTSKVTNINIENVADSTIDAGNTQDALEAKNSTDVTSGMDRPNIGLNHSQFVMKPRPNISNFANVDQVTVLAGRAGGTAELRPNDIATTSDEMSLKHICSKPTFFRKIQLAASDDQGTKLASWKLIPNPIMAHGSKNEILTPTMAGFAVQPFAYWHGDLTYTFEFVGSGFHTARLAFCAHYGRDAETIPFTEAMAQYASVVDFNGANQTAKITVPYKAATDFLRVPPGDMDTDWHEGSMGEFSVWVITSLQAPETVSAEITLNVYFSIDNVVLKYPSANSIDYWPGYDITDLENDIPDSLPEVQVETPDGQKYKLQRHPRKRITKRTSKSSKHTTRTRSTSTPRTTATPYQSPTDSDDGADVKEESKVQDRMALSYSKLPNLPKSTGSWFKV